MTQTDVGSQAVRSAWCSTDERTHDQPTARSDPRLPFVLGSILHENIYIRIITTAVKILPVAIAEHQNAHIRQQPGNPNMVIPPRRAIPIWGRGLTSWKPSNPCKIW